MKIFRWKVGKTEVVVEVVASTVVAGVEVREEQLAVVLLDFQLLQIPILLFVVPQIQTLGTVVLEVEEELVVLFV